MSAITTWFRPRRRILMWITAGYTTFGIIALGLGAILMASTTAFDIMKWCGALYLMWLGIQKFREEPVPFEEIAARTEFKDTSTKGIFLQGFLVSQTNPKGLIFLLAVLPQFVDPTLPTAMQYVILTLTLVCVDINRDLEPKLQIGRAHV